MARPLDYQAYRPSTEDTRPSATRPLDYRAIQAFVVAVAVLLTATVVVNRSSAVLDRTLDGPQSQNHSSTR